MKRIAFIMGQFHRELVGRMRTEATDVAHDLSLSITKEIWVPGAFEVPLALKRTLSLPDVDGAVLLGIIERGETKHGLVMAQAVFPAVIDLQLETNKPVGIGIIGPEVKPNQIESRLLPHARAAVEAVSHMFSCCCD